MARLHCSPNRIDIPSHCSIYTRQDMRVGKAMRENINIYMHVLFRPPASMSSFSQFWIFFLALTLSLSPSMLASFSLRFFFLFFSPFHALSPHMHIHTHQNLFWLPSSAWSASQRSGPFLKRTPTKRDGKAGFWIRTERASVLGKIRPRGLQRLKGLFLPQVECHEIKYRVLLLRHRHRPIHAR